MNNDMPETHNAQHAIMRALVALLNHSLLNSTYGEWDALRAAKQELEKWMELQ